jgi:hypothetical protein
MYTLWCLKLIFVVLTLTTTKPIIKETPIYLGHRCPAIIRFICALAEPPDPIRLSLPTESPFLANSMTIGFAKGVWRANILDKASHINVSYSRSKRLKKGFRYDTYHMVLYVTRVTFRMTRHMNKWTNAIGDDGWVHPLAKTLPNLISNLWWNIIGSIHGWGTTFGCLTV